jgi:class 3 adenylate cyclase/tetratricopeptide (TPR) repeat protein
MHCQECGASNTMGPRFCNRCGAALPVTCPSCSIPNNPDANFCVQCGSRLPAALEERKWVTLLFADIKGSTELIQGRQQDPEHVKRILAPVVRIMSAAATRYGGRVDRIPLGDAIMAAFGAPQALEDHAVRACLAALSLQDSVRRWNEAQQRSGSKLEYQVRVGLSSGEIVTSERLIDGPYGEATILASRMEGLAAPGKVLLTKSTWLLAKGFVRAIPLGPQRIRGKDDALEVFELEGVEARTRFNARQNQGLTQFVGRDAELDVLARALRRADTGDGQIVIVTGGPGVGKSRLVHHFFNLGVARDAIVLETSAEPYDRDSVYLPIANLLRAELNVLPSDPPSAIQEKLDARLSLRPDLLEAAGALLDLPASREAGGWRDLDPVLKRRRIGDAVRELILMAPRPSALILVIEDLQWLDEDTSALVTMLIEQVRSRRVLLILTSRESVPVQGRHCQILSMDTLEPLRAQELLTHLIGDAPELDQLRDVMFRRSDGRPTPLFIEETVSSLVEQGVLSGEAGRYQLAGTLDGLEREIPHKVEEVLAVRIDRLAREHKQVLESASVIGMETPLELLASVAHVDVGPLLRILGDLDAAGLMYESLSSGRSEFRFKHVLTREAALTRIPLLQRQNLHARTVLAIEALYAHRRDEWIDRLADHASRASLPDKAFTYFAESCSRAIEHSANRHAVAIFEKGLTALSALPAEDGRTQDEIDLRLMVLNALLPLGEQDRIGQLLHEAKTLASSIADLHRLAKVEVLLTLFLWEAGKHHEALESGAAALKLATGNGLDRVSLAARVHIGIVHHALGQFRDTLALHRAVLDELIAAGLEKRRFGWAAYPSIITRAFCADACIVLGEFELADAFIREGELVTQELGHPYSWTMIATVKGRYHLARDEPAIATEIFERVEQRCRDDEVHTMVPAAVAGLGTALARSGRAESALRKVQDALEQKTYRRSGNYGHYYLLMALGEAQGTVARFDEAIATLNDAERLARNNHEVAHAAQARYSLATLQVRRDPRVAEAAYREVLACAQQCGMRPLEAACWWGLADAGRLLGDAGGSPASEKARVLYQQLGLTGRAAQIS